MPRNLKRYQESRQSHFVTFSCYHRQALLRAPARCDLFVEKLEQTRKRYGLRVYGYVVMPEHVHLLLSEPDRDLLADALHSLKLAVSKSVSPDPSHVSAQKQGASVGHPPKVGHAKESARLWQSRYYDRNVQDYEEFVEKLRYIHRNPVKRGLVERPEDWPWSSFRHYAAGEVGMVEIESEWTARRRASPPR